MTGDAHRGNSRILEQESGMLKTLNVQGPLPLPDRPSMWFAMWARPFVKLLSRPIITSCAPLEDLIRAPRFCWHPSVGLPWSWRFF